MKIRNIIGSTEIEKRDVKKRLKNEKDKGSSNPEKIDPLGLACFFRKLECESGSQE